MKYLNGQEFLYDKVSRFKSGSVVVGGAPRSQQVSYDGWGNMLSITTNGVTRNLPTTATTNRLTSGTYEPSGNLTGWNGAAYGYDRLNMMKQLCSSGTLTSCTGENWVYAYTADDERILSYRLGGGAFQSAIRDLDGKILREYKTELGGWPAFEDYIYRGRTPLASIHPTEGTRYFGTDHLGSPRFVFSPTSPTFLATHTYYPFGEEATATTQDTQQMKFTGHERDLLNTPTATADDTDNMHARQFSLQLGRFMSTDPVRGDPHQPQSFNLYGYVLGNPLKYVDPTGRCALWIPIKDEDGNEGGAICIDEIDVVASRRDPGGSNTGDKRKPPRENDEGERERQIDGGCAGTTIGVSGSVSGVFGISDGRPVIGVWGINIQFLPGAIGIYEFGSLRDRPSTGATFGATLTSNFGVGSGHWGSEFLESAASVGPVAAGAYTSPGGPGRTSWSGVALGLAYGAPVGHMTSTNFYKPLLVIGPNANACE